MTSSGKKTFGGFGQENEGFSAVIDKYVPDPEEIDLKGRLNREQPRLITLAEMLPYIWDELEGLEETVGEFVTRYERRLISVDRGDKDSARDEYCSILTSARRRDRTSPDYNDPTNMFIPQE